MLLLGVPLWCLVALTPASPRLRWSATRGTGRTIRELTGVDLRVDGDPPGPGESVVVAANHASFVDALVLLLALPGPVVFVTSDEFGAKPLIGRFLRRLGCVFVHRDPGGRTAADVSAMVGTLAGGRTLAVFPEGSIVRAPGIRPFHLGAFAAASDAGCAVVPVGLTGTREIVRPGSFLPRRVGAVRVAFGPPLPPSGTGFAAAADLGRQARDAVAALCGEPEVDR